MRDPHFEGDKTANRIWRQTVLGACVLSGLAWTVEAGAQLPGSSTNSDLLAPVQPTPAAVGTRLEVNDAPATAAASDAQDTRQWPIDVIEIEGNQVFTQEQLLQAVVPKRSGLFTFDEMQKIAQSIQDHYRKNGYPASICLLPEQDITEGHLRFRVLEGRLVEHGVRMATQAGTDPVAESAVQARNEAIADLISKAVVASGVLDLPLIRQDDLEGALMRAGEVAGKKITAQLGPGADLGTSRVDIQAEDKDKFSGALMMSNLGDATTGKTLASVSVRAESLFDHGDQLDVGYSASEHPERLNSYNLKYDNTVGLQGWRVGARAWKSNYRIGGSLSALQALGTASAEGIYASYPLLRTNLHLADLSFGYSEVSLRDQNILTGANPRRSKETWLNLSGTLQDQALGTDARTLWTMTTTSGTLAFENASRRAQDASGLQTQGVFGLFTASVAREQNLPVKKWSFYAKLKLQKSLSNNQDSYRKIGLGGADDVRAYAAGESTGDEGAIGKLELRYSQPVGSDAVLQLAPFYDRGWVRVNMNPVSSTASNSILRAGHGLEATWVWKTNLEIKTFWAQATTGVSNVDGKRDRVGLRVTARY